MKKLSRRQHLEKINDECEREFKDTQTKIRSLSYV